MKQHLRTALLILACPAIVSTHFTFATNQEVPDTPSEVLEEMTQKEELSQESSSYTVYMLSRYSIVNVPDPVAACHPPMRMKYDSPV